MTSPTSSRDLGSLRGSTLPRLGTPRSSRATAAGWLVDLARRVREPLLPWQQHALEVALEVETVDDWRRWRWAYDTVGLLVARQNGKTRLLKWRILGELFRFAGRRVLHTAQDRAVPREMFLELAELIESRPELAVRVRKIREAQGQETIWLRSGAQYRILAPRQDRFRSWPASLVVFDEAREHRTLELGDAARPTLTQAARPQLWYVSNAGDPDSVRLNVVRSRGVASLEDPTSDPRMCYLEWSAETSDVEDLDGWEAANPALGLTNLDGEVLLSALQEARASADLSGFITERLCRWVPVTSAAIVTPEEWEACRARRRPKPFVAGEDRIVMSIDVDPEGRNAALIAAAVRGQRVIVQVLEHWDDPEAINEAEVAAAVADWALEWQPEAIGYDPFTTAGVAAELETRYPARAEKITGQSYVTACTQLVDAVRNERLRHMGDPYLDEQVRSAGRRAHGDGMWRIARLESSAPIPAVMALARAVHLAYRPRLVPEVF